MVRHPTAELRTEPQPRAPAWRNSVTALRPWILLAACGFGSLLLHLSPLEARQVVTEPGPRVQGVVTDQESGVPLATGYVSLHRPDGEQVAQAFTDDQGRYSLRAPGPGTYRARAERMGYHPQETDPFTLGASETLTLDFLLSRSPLLLDSILVSVQRQGRPLRAGEQLVYGRLLDDESREPIPQGLLRLLQESGRSTASTLSDDEGLFWLVSPTPGSYRIQAERLGYQTATGPPLQLMPGDTIGVDFYLSMEAILLNPLVVTATARPLSDRYDMTGMAGFWRRYNRFSRSGYGEFLTRDTLAKYEQWTHSMAQIMMLTLMSVRGGSLTTGLVSVGRGCTPLYFFEGSPIEPQDVWSISPDILESVEVYVRPTIPPEFWWLGRMPCGVVAYWIRREPHQGVDAPAWKKVLAGAGVLGIGLFLILLK